MNRRLVQLTTLATIATLFVSVVLLITAQSKTILRCAAEQNDDHFIACLRTRYNEINIHTQQFLGLRLGDLTQHSFEFSDIHYTLDSTSFSVNMEIGATEGEYLSLHAQNGDLASWGESLLKELEAHTPQRTIHAEMGWTVYSTSYVHIPPSSCSGSSDVPTEGPRGFTWPVTLIQISFSPPTGERTFVCRP